MVEKEAKKGKDPVKEAEGSKPAEAIKPAEEKPASETADVPAGEQKEHTLEKAIKLARENSKQRKFEQTWDFIINLRGLDLKKPENRFSSELALPKGRGKEPKVAVFADLMATEAGKFADLVINKKEIDGLVKNKKKMKHIANEYDFFFGEAPLMPVIGKSLGTVLGPRGKVPKPMPPKGNIEPMLRAAKRMVKIMLKETPVIYAMVGTEKMDDKDVAENAAAVYNLVKEKLPKGRNNIKSTLIKLTMGRPMKISIK